jgi:broad-specificity NMP kinase
MINTKQKKPCFIIIRGPAGVGKTTIARELANKIKGEVFHFDKIMKQLGLDYIPGEKCIPLWKFLKADGLMIPKFREKLEKGIIIIDGNFYFKRHINDLVKKMNSSHFIFTLKANLQACINRDKTRKDCLGKKDIRDVFKFVSAFDSGISINTNNKSVENIVKEIISYLPK